MTVVKRITALYALQIIRKLQFNNTNMANTRNFVVISHKMAYT